MAQVAVACLLHRVQVDVDDVVQHAHRGVNRLAQLDVVDVPLFVQVPGQVHRPDVAHRDLVGARIQRDLCAEVGRTGGGR